MKVPVYSIKGEKINEMELSDDVFNVAPNPALLHEVMIGYQSNARQPLAHTKTRGEVSGGGKKPWKQKGTGQARHGSNRSPLWVGGGVTFGPRNDVSFKKKINKKVAQKALKMVLSDRVNSGSLVIVEGFDFPELKTKIGVLFLNKVCGNKKHALVVIQKNAKDSVRVFKNIPKIGTTRVEDVNAYDVAKFEKILFSVDGITELYKRLIKKV